MTRTPLYLMLLASAALAGCEAETIVAGPNVVDATLAGLTADRDEIGAGLLGEMEAPP